MLVVGCCCDRYTSTGDSLLTMVEVMTGGSLSLSKATWQYRALIRHLASTAECIFAGALVLCEGLLRDSGMPPGLGCSPSRRLGAVDSTDTDEYICRM